jgi:hypothetical protein
VGQGGQPEGQALNKPKPSGHSGLFQHYIPYKNKFDKDFFKDSIPIELLAKSRL